jgi:Fe-S-cluster containining protein
MNAPSKTERFDIALKTPAGSVTSPVDVPTGFVPVSAIVPLVRRMGEEALALEEQRARDAGRSVSCRKGCAACCRMLVPVSVPEAFALADALGRLPDQKRDLTYRRLEATRARLEEAGLWNRLLAISETTRALEDEDFAPINRDYYALRLPCPFLEDEICSIYEDRPAACRELLVTSPAELCQDIESNPVTPLPVAVRVSTALGLLWADLKKDVPRLIPLPVAIEWVRRHRHEPTQTWPGTELLDRALEKLWRLLGQAFEKRSGQRAANSE